MTKLTELIVVLVFIVAPQLPQFFLANSVDTDEWQKSGSGVAISGLILGAYKVYKDKTNQ